MFLAGRRTLDLITDRTSGKLARRFDRERSQIGKLAAIGERTARLVALVAASAAVIAMLAFAAPAGAWAGAELAQGQAQTTDDGQSWLPVYVGLIGLGVGLLIVLVRRGRHRVGRWVGPSVDRVVTSSGRFARSLVPLMLVPVEAVSTVAKWRPSRPEALERLTRKEPAVAEPEEAALAEREDTAVAELEEEPPPPDERLVGSPAQDAPRAQAPRLDAALVARASLSPPPPPAAAPPEPPPAAPTEEPQPSSLQFAVPPPTTWERCEVEWWRGYIKSDFYAVAFRPTGEWYVAERSPSFRWRHTEPPREGSAGREEHAHLVGRLVRDGWQPVGNGPVWYQTRFRRPVPPSLDELAGTLESQGTGAES
jgi:hypothetical protein